MVARALCELTLLFAANNSGQIILSGNAIRQLRVSIARLEKSFFWSTAVEYEDTGRVSSNFSTFHFLFVMYFPLV